MNLNKPRKRNPALLIALAGAAALYAGWLLLWPTHRGRAGLEGSVGVLLGLYICSQPVASLLDVILYGRIYASYETSHRSNMWWLALNLLIFVIGFFTLFFGATRLVRFSG
jgi:hypothetical protein